MYCPCENIMREVNLEISAVDSNQSPMPDSGTDFWMNRVFQFDHFFIRELLLLEAGSVYLRYATRGSSNEAVLAFIVC
jgi:hypothetical protein